MAEGQKKRKIGSNMKPRKNAGKTHKQESAVTMQEPTNEGQPESIIQPVLDHISATETGGSLEPENEPKNEPEIEASVSQVPAESEPSQAEINDLSALMGANPTIIRPGAAVEAAERKQVQQSPDDWPKVCIHDNPVTVACPQCAASDLVNSQPENSKEAKYFVGIDAGTGESAAVAIVRQMPNGDEAVTVTIPEEFVEAVKQWAESDGVPVERWLSDRLYEYIVGYGNAPQGR